MYHSLLFFLINDTNMVENTITIIDKFAVVVNLEVEPVPELDWELVVELKVVVVVGVVVLVGRTIVNKKVWYAEFPKVSVATMVILCDPCCNCRVDPDKIVLSLAWLSMKMITEYPLVSVTV